GADAAHASPRDDRPHETGGHPDQRGPGRPGRDGGVDRGAAEWTPGGRGTGRVRSRAAAAREPAADDGQRGRLVSSGRGERAGGPRAVSLRGKGHCRLDPRRTAAERCQRGRAPGRPSREGDPMNDSMQRMTLRKVAWRLLPLLFILYVVNILDRVNV